MRSSVVLDPCLAGHANAPILLRAERLAVAAEEGRLWEGCQRAALLAETNRDRIRSGDVGKAVAVDEDRGGHIRRPIPDLEVEPAGDDHRARMQRVRRDER